MAKRSLTNVATAELQRELQRRGRKIDSLLARRERLEAEIAAIDAEVGALHIVTGGGGKRGGARTAGRGRRRANGRRAGRKRPRNEMNLVEALAKVLKGKEMALPDIITGVQKAGYKTSSPNFRTIVNQTLINNKKNFKRVARGVYTSK